MSERYTSGAQAAALIRAELERQGRTWAEVAKSAGVRNAYLYELPRHEHPMLGCIEHVARVLKVRPAALLYVESLAA